jgi:hypothetical protein
LTLTLGFPNSTAVLSQVDRTALALSSGGQEQFKSRPPTPYVIAGPGFLAIHNTPTVHMSIMSDHRI